MDTLSAFAMGQMNRHCEPKVFDWDKAATLIKERQPEIAVAGLAGDWGYTSGIIFEDGKPTKDPCAFLASTWATPLLELDGEADECYKLQSDVPEWGADTQWPQSALDILRGE